MDYQKVIEYKLQTLIDIMLTDGVSPSELSNNIFEEDYINISFSKVNDFVVGKLNFYENGNKLKNVQMVYTYSQNKKLIKVEEVENRKRKILWDREKREDELIEELLYFMTYCYDENQIKKFILTLPDNLKNKVQNHRTALIEKTHIHNNKGYKERFKRIDLLIFNVYFIGFNTIYK